MRCPQCGFDAASGAAFCSRCGARLMSPRPEAKREYALSRIRQSWWRFAGVLAVALALLAFALRDFYVGAPQPRPLVMIALGVLLWVRAALVRRSTSWSLTSERLIERRGFLSSRRRELELADIRSVEVSRSFPQRLLGLGNVVVASAASADFLIKLESIAQPDAVAEAVRQARLKRLA